MPSNASSSCLTDEQITELAEGILSPSGIEALEPHLAVCADCRRLLAEMTLRSGSAEAAPASAPFVLEDVDPARYEVGREIARGGMGRILEAWDRRHRRRVAIKVLLKPGAAGELRFAREARITGRLQHPSIVALYEAGRWPSGEPFFAMKLVAGRPLDRAVASLATLEERLSLLPNLLAATEALAYAHEQRVVHRDLKPANVLLGAFGETVVIDWGLAKDIHDEDGLARDPHTAGGEAPAEMTAPGAALGTPAYMPPEQARGERVDARADVYALGALLYHAFAGEPPFVGANGREVLKKVLASGPVPLAERVPALAPDLLAIVGKAMARDRGDRYESAGAMAEDLRRFARGQLVGAHRYTMQRLVWRWVVRHRAAVTMGAAFLAAVALIAGLSVRRIVHERDRADALKVEAERQRATAVAQRDAAETLVGFFIGEIRDRLDALGKLELLAGVGNEVERYYEALGPEREGDGVDALGRRAAALDLLANVEDQRRNFEPAEALARAEVAISEAARRRDPKGLDAALALTRARTTLAVVLHDALRGGEAGVESGRADALGTELVAIAPSDARAKILAAYARALKGIGHAVRGEHDSARVQAEDARRLLSGIDAAALDATWKDQLAAAYARVGSVATATSDWPLCAEMFRTHNELRRQELEARPDHLGRLAALANGLRSFAFAEENLAAHDVAAKAYRASIEIRTGLLAREPDNLTLEYDQAFAFAMLCSLERAWSGPSAAEPTCTEGRTLAERLVATRPDDARAHDALSRALRAIGYLEHARKREDRATSAFTAALQHARRALDRTPTAPYLKAGVLESIYGRAIAETARGRAEGALAPLREGIAMAEARLAEDPDDLQFVANLACLLVALGDAERTQGARAAARDRYTRAIDLFERAAAADPSDADSRLALAEAEHKLASIAIDAARRTELRSHAQRIVEALASAGKVSPEWVAEIEAAAR